MEITSIRYINLNKNWDRRFMIDSLLNQFPFKVVRCEGVIYEENNINYKKYLTNGYEEYLKNDNRIRGAIGCWIAHSQVLEGIKEREGITVVIEDDFVCKSGFFENALRMVNTFDRDFDVILFDTWGTGPLQAHKIANNIYQSKNYGFPFYGGTHCVFINNAQIPKILEVILDSKIVDYDGFLLGQEKINTYVFFTGQCAPRGIGSDITPTFKLKYDLMGMVTSLYPLRIKERTKVFKKYFNKPKERKIQVLSDERLRTLEGFYKAYGQENRYIKFTIQETNLLLTQLWNGRQFLLHPISELEFFNPDFPIPIVFKMDMNGEIIEVLVLNQTLYSKVHDENIPKHKAVQIPPKQLKFFEGKYHHNNELIIQIQAKEDHLIIEQLWDEKRYIFLPESDFDFFDKNNPFSSIKFLKANSGEIQQVQAFGKYILDKIEDVVEIPA